MSEWIPSGAQWTIASERSEAVIVEVGGGLRTFTHAGREVLGGYPESQMCQHGRGQQLMPWPNRIRDGRFTLDGTVHQLPLSEALRGNASHGLVRWARWKPLDHERNWLVVGHRLPAQPGYPWQLSLRTTYRLDGPRLTVSTHVTNQSPTPAPFGYGAHPYLALGGADPAAVRVTVPAERFLEVDAQRLLPTGTTEVTGTAYDLRDGPPLGDRELDTAYTGISPDDDGRWRVSMATDEHRTTLWADQATFGWLQVFTEKARVGDPAYRGVAVEPMTCPPDAFNSGDGLIMLAAGQSWTGEWGVDAE